MSRNHPQRYLEESVYPEIEGNTLEFKESICKKNLRKISETICGFLNCEGGYIIFGVKDKTREICGLNVKGDSEIDSFILAIDDIYHKRLIVSQEDHNSVPQGHIICKAYETSSRKKIVIIEVLKSGDDLYQLCDGSVIYRANASNYRCSSERMYTEAEYKAGLAHQNRENAKVVRALAEDLNQQNKILTQAERDRQKYEELLAAKILLEKKLAETQVVARQENEKNSILPYFIRNCFGL